MYCWGKAAENKRFGYYQLRFSRVKWHDMPFFAYLFLGIRKTFEEKGERLVGDRPDLFGAGFVDTHYYGCSRNQRQKVVIFASNWVMFNNSWFSWLCERAEILCGWGEGGRVEDRLWKQFKASRFPSHQRRGSSNRVLEIRRYQNVRPADNLRYRGIREWDNVGYSILQYIIWREKM